MSIQILVCLSTIFHISNAYYLSLHALEWLNASNYCQSYCNSHLASVHSASQHLSTLALIDENPYIYTRVWLGLNDIQKSDTWEWSDGSNFDGFGSIKDTTTGRIIRGTAPWRSDEPDYNDSDQCVALEVGSNYIGSNSRKWVDRRKSANYQFFCNECSGGRMNKYAAVNGARNFSEAERICGDRFGTSLASIHNINDMIEAKTVCEELTNSNGCWIGLNDINERRIYKWTDGTEWDYGSQFFQFPWYQSEPGSTLDQQCIFLDPSNGADPGKYRWDDYWCHKRAPRAICNSPSEICNKNQWVVLRGNPNNWQWNKKPCNIIKTIMEKESIAILGNKQYLNTDGILKIDMMYSIENVGLHGSAGVVLYFDSSNCNNYYYIGIWAGHGLIFIGKHSEQNEWQLIQHQQINFILGIKHLLTIELKNGTEWNILFNGQSIIHTIDNEFNNRNNKLSGYIGIRNVNVETYIKYLYISGQLQHENNNIWYKQCTNSPTLSPTILSINPSINPTLHPSINPTLHPSTNPTLEPSNTPTLEPTFIPSTNPTLEPTKQPTNSPSAATDVPTARTLIRSEPTILPTFIPTYNPSKNPTKEPIYISTYNPSKNPTNEPTFEPTFVPIIFKSTNNNDNNNLITTYIPTQFPIIKTTYIPTQLPIIKNIQNQTQNQTQNQSFIWIIGIPIGLIMFCFFGIYLLYIYCKQNIYQRKQKTEEHTNITTPSNSFNNNNKCGNQHLSIDQNIEVQMPMVSHNIEDNNENDNNNDNNIANIENNIENNTENETETDNGSSQDGQNVTIPLNYRMRPGYSRY